MYEYLHKKFESPIRCPHCSSDNYTCEEDGTESDCFYECYVCDDCNTIFRVWYELKYIETEYTVHKEQQEADYQYYLSNMERIEKCNKQAIEQCKEKLMRHADKIPNKEFNNLINKLDKNKCKEYFSSQGYFNDWRFNYEVDRIIKELTN